MVVALERFQDTEFLAKAILYAREKGFMREAPVMGAVVLSKKDIGLYKRIYTKVMRNPRDWEKLIDICRSKAIRQGLGRAIKNSIKYAVSQMTAYHAVKYPSAVRDMIRIARIPEKVNPTVIKYIMENDHSIHETLKILKAIKEEEDPKKVAKLIREAKLPYEVVTGSVNKMAPEIWEALLYSAPYFNLLRNLNNFGRNGVFKKKKNLEYAIKTLTDPERIRSSMLFPFRYYVAYKMLEDFEGSEELRNAILKALEYSVVNVPEIEGRVAICPDVSGSMASNLTGDNSVVQCIDLVGLFTGILAKKCKDTPKVLPFRHEVVLEMGEKAVMGETVMDIADVFYASGGTSLSSPIQHLLENDIKVDRIIAFTDNEEWVGTSFHKALAEYLNRYPDTHVYLVTLLPYRDYPTPTDHPNVHYIFGWNDNVLKYILMDKDAQIKEVENINIP